MKGSNPMSEEYRITIRDKYNSAMDALASIWKGRYPIDHKYWCNSTHNTGLPCDCGLAELKAIVEDILGEKEQPDE